MPVYLAEMAPFEIRGSLAGRNELMIVVGQLAAFVVNAIIASSLGHLDGVWRLMFAICALPAIVLFFGMRRMPEPSVCVRCFRTGTSSSSCSSRAAWA